MRAEASDDLTITVYEKFREVPRNVRVALFIGARTFEHVIEFTRLATVDIYFAEDREISLIFALGKFQNLCVCSRLLSAKLIARKSQNGERVIAEFFLQSTQPGVLIGQASAAGHIDDQTGFSCKLVKGDIVALGIGHGEFMKLAHQLSFVGGYTTLAQSDGSSNASDFPLKPQ